MSSPPSSSSADAWDIMNFDTDGAWDSGKHRGPAIHTPIWLRNLRIVLFRIEFIDLAIPADNFFSKNHIVGTGILANPIFHEGDVFLSVRISMETAEVMKKVTDTGPGYVSGVHYNPGIFTVALLKYKTPHHHSAHELTYTLAAGTTVGEVIDEAIQRNMHHYLFLPYTEECRWKGCGDFMLHFWAVLIRTGRITSENSAENPDEDLATELTVTWRREGGRVYEPIGRGWWIQWNPVQDRYTDETVYTVGCLTHQLPQNR